MVWPNPKKEDSGEMTPYTAAALAMLPMCDKRRPFDRFDCLDVEVDAAFSEDISAFGYAYKIVHYLLMLQDRFGLELVEIVTAYLRVMAGRVKNGQDEHDSIPFFCGIVDFACRMKEVTISAYAAQKFRTDRGENMVSGDCGLNAEEIPLEWSLALVLLATFPESPLVRNNGGNRVEVDNIPGNLDLALAKVLLKAKEASAGYYADLVHVT